MKRGDVWTRTSFGSIGPFSSSLVSLLREPSDHSSRRALICPPIPTRWCSGGFVVRSSTRPDTPGSDRIGSRISSTSAGGSAAGRAVIPRSESTGRRMTSSSPRPSIVSGSIGCRAGDPADHRGFIIALSDLAPYPFLSRPIDPGDYRPTIIITRD